jgi:predicted metal-binding membrane protein
MRFRGWAATAPSPVTPPAARTLSWDGAPGRRALTSAVLAAVAASWTALWLWGRSGSAHQLDHDRLAIEGLPAMAGLMAGWALMTVAMMLPASMSMIAWFHGVAGGRSRRGPMVVVLVGGFLAAWMVFGAAVHTGDWALHQASARLPWLSSDGWAFGPVVLALAGAYQFTPLKQRCLARCCAVPRRMTRDRWGAEQRPARAAFAMGVREGAWSVGCCWALMLLMAAAGMSSLAHMLAVGTVMATETVDKGHRFRAPLGLTLIVVGLATFALGAAAG